MGHGTTSTPPLAEAELGPLAPHVAPARYILTLVPGWLTLRNVHELMSRAWQERAGLECYALR